ncbi:alpha-galactosidase [Paenibacillus sp. FSL H7-0331]|uniref:alpha-galactosidase n=1 Tax=Paenibacillus sp. FSL H7-0331 TaxID=1920421 RepID=UPI00096C1EAD|nr:alpha-galactosidase [Paenibacillus sp. FSL H7-0331]OMF15775.1 alpha-galactosidase [Paenibacillus sp. FSL H7-0331]
MGIQFDAEQQLFHLQAADTSYGLQILESGYVVHLYWGRKINHLKASHWLQLGRDRSFSPNPDPADRNYSLDWLPQEYPAYGNSDYRQPAIQIQLENGSTITDFKYESHRIIAGKPTLDGLPSTYIEHADEALTLEITLIDGLTGLKAVLTYTVYENHNVLTRSVRLINEGLQTLKVLRVLSMSIDMADSGYDLLQLSGAWARERYVEKRALVPGTQSIESRRGGSSHQQNPFIALLAKGSTEDHGDVYGFSLVYSGSFLASVEVDQFNTTRVGMGINPFDFSWLLEPGQSFQAPEVVMVHSANGLGGMSQTYHELYRTRLCRGTFRDQSRPVLINNWEATYFDFTADQIEQIAKAGKELGIELFVLDDGWFGKRNDDKTSLGDWFVNLEKLPEGLGNLAERITKLDMQFGLWFEPEMVSVESELYRAHPDWCLHVPNRTRSEGRNQLILDLSRSEVCDYIVNTVSGVLNSAPITYVKWDMNRSMTEIGSASLPPERQRETAHRYMLGLYSVMERITSAFTHILFESCSGGGGRFDPGILHYMPQTWTSDNTDAVTRLKIQYGTSIVYPISSMGAHVSAIPNHQVHRNTSLQMRGDVAMSGNFGYELDLTKFTSDERELAKQQVAMYKELRQFVQFGSFYRLLSPFEGNTAAWMFVSTDGQDCLVCYFQILCEPNEPTERIKLKGLDADSQYIWLGTDEVYGGDELMYGGFVLPALQGDYQSFLVRLKRV